MLGTDGAPDSTDDATDLNASDATSLGASPSASTAPNGPRPAAPSVPLPARLAASAWLGALSTASGARSVQVGLGDDGTVRLRTERGTDGVAVRIQFSDPELQTLAGAHAARLRDLLESHFAEPVRLSFADPSAGGGASDGFGAGGDRDPAARPAPNRSASGVLPDASLPTTRPSVTAGRHEWIG